MINYVIIYPLLVPPRKTHPNCNQKNTYPSTSLVFTQTTPLLLAILLYIVPEYKRGIVGSFVAFKYPTASRALNIPPNYLGIYYVIRGKKDIVVL